jgi:hypothetical protein
LLTFRRYAEVACSEFEQRIDEVSPVDLEAIAASQGARVSPESIGFAIRPPNLLAAN